MEEVMHNSDLFIQILEKLPEEDQARCQTVCKSWNTMLEPVVAPIRRRRMNEEVLNRYRERIERERTLTTYLAANMEEGESLWDVIVDAKRVKKLEPFRWRANEFMNLRRHNDPVYWTKSKLAELASVHSRALEPQG